jgi:succinate dehydrogenase cytochrome b subunit
MDAGEIMKTIRYKGVTHGWSSKSQVWAAVGMWAWLGHRLSGLGLGFYIFLHTILMGSALLAGEQAFNARLGLLMGSPIFKVLDAMLLSAVYYHGLNGLRVVLFDLGIGVAQRSQKVLFWAFMAVAAILWIWSVCLIFV